MKQNFYKVDDYILRADTELQQLSDNGIRRGDGISRIFNFLSRQVTTVDRAWVYEARGSSAAGTSAISSNSRVESFDDLPGSGEIAHMHAKLCELGGKPPALADVMPKNIGKSAAPGLRSPAQKD